MINLIHFYDKDGKRFVMNGSSIPESAADHADRRVADFLTQFCIEAKLSRHVKEHHGGSEWGYANEVLDEAKMIAEAKSRGIGVAYDEDDMRRRNAPAVKVVTLADIRAQLGANLRKNVWDHALAVVDIIEARMATDYVYEALVCTWLSGATGAGTVYLRDMIMEPIRHLPEIVEIGKQFNPTTEWHNTWMPIDSAMHRVRNGVDPEDW